MQLELVASAAPVEPLLAGGNRCRLDAARWCLWCQLLWGSCCWLWGSRCRLDGLLKGIWSSWCPRCQLGTEVWRLSHMDLLYFPV